MLQVMLIFLGSGVGGVCRYALSGWAQRLGDATTPLGTLTVNLLGCLITGFLAATFAEYLLLRPEYRAALLIGVMGGFTTFSTFGLETFALLADGQIALAAANVGASVIGGIAATGAGWRLASLWFGG